MSDSKVVTLSHNSGSSAKVHLFGGTVISWVCQGKENLFVSKISKMDGSKAVRGGIPLVFPNFGPWKLGPQHGFARSMWWTPGSQENLENGDVKQVFTLVDNEESRKLWNHSFKLEYTVVLSESKLYTELSITNTGGDSFDFTTLLHTYFHVDDISQCKLTGFKDVTFVDKVANTGKDEVESREVIVIDRNVDNIYKNTNTHEIIEGNRTITLEKNNLPDTVLWNPWIVKAQQMSDFNNDGYKNMVCVEEGRVVERKILNSDENFKCDQTLTCKL